MLNRSGYAHSHVERGGDGAAGLTDLVGRRNPALLDGPARGADGSFDELSQFLDEGGSGDGAAAWPFEPAQEPWSNVLEIQKTVQAGRNPWRGKLANVRELACFEYKVEVAMDDGSRYELDPVIIVRT